MLHNLRNKKVHIFKVSAQRLSVAVNKNISFTESSMILNYLCHIRLQEFVIDIFK